MRIRYAGLGCVLGLGLALWGCSHEEGPHQKTPADIQAEIDKAQNDPKMPANIKAMVVGLLKQQKDKAEKGAASTR